MSKGLVGAIHPCKVSIFAGIWLEKAASSGRIVPPLVSTEKAINSAEISFKDFRIESAAARERPASSSQARTWVRILSTTASFLLLGQLDWKEAVNGISKLKKRWILIRYLASQLAKFQRQSGGELPFPKAGQYKRPRCYTYQDMLANDLPAL
jgi:hypothetical protein